MADVKQETGCAVNKDFREVEKYLKRDTDESVSELASDRRQNPGKNKGDLDYGSAVAKTLRATNEFGKALSELARLNELSTSSAQTSCDAITDMQFGLNNLVRGVIDQNYLMEELKPGKNKQFSQGNVQAANHKQKLSLQSASDNALVGGPGDIDDSTTPLISLARRFYTFTERLSGVTWSPDKTSDPELRLAITKRLDKSSDGIAFLTSMVKDAIEKTKNGDNEGAAISINTLRDSLMTMDRDLKNFDNKLVLK